MTKTVGYRISWTARSGAQKSVDFDTLQAARLYLNHLVLDFGYDARLSSRRKSFNEVVILIDSTGDAHKL